MACFAVCCGSCACCCGGCTYCFCWTTWRVGRAALKVVQDIRARPPCEAGLACQCQEEEHFLWYSHPDDSDYGFAVRVHGGQGEFCTLRQCFNFMDPYQLGYVNEVAALRELLLHVGPNANDPRIVSRVNTKQHLMAIWKSIDTDGNGYISFPEFAEWALANGVKFGFPRHIGIVGPKYNAGEYSLRCTVEGCTCTSFQSGGATGSFCSTPGCGHRKGLHAAPNDAQIRAVLPPNWSCDTTLDTPAHIAGQHRLISCCSEVVSQVQELMDATVKRTWTRDRGKENKVPLGYRVVRVDRNENVRLWLKYVAKKALILEAITDSSSQRELPPLERYDMMTSASAQTLPFLESCRPDAEKNEWYLWHGAPSKGIKSIAEQEFKQMYAGVTTGTLYGSGTYLSDSCTKADEYAKEATSGEDGGLFCLLLCRVMGGRVKYTDEVQPAAATLMRDVLQGPYDCVLGDRTRCRGTFKEIVIYESSQAYPEFLVYYKRFFDAEPGAGDADG